MDGKKRNYVPPSFGRRSRLFSLRRLVLAISLTGVIFYFHPSILSSFSSSPNPHPQSNQLPKTPQQQRFEEAPPPLKSNHLSPPTFPEQKPVDVGEDEIFKVSYPAHSSSSSISSTKTRTSATTSKSAELQSASQSASTSASTSPVISASPKPNQQAAQSVRVALEAHLMSKCPDARDCLQQLLVPAMTSIDSLVNLTLYYIGTVASDPSSPSDGVTCKHGPGECLGNTISLCAQHLYPKTNGSISAVIPLGFTNCLISSYKSIPEKSLVQDCALEFGIDFEALNRCASSEASGQGEDLLRQSVLQSREKGVSKSCTVRLDGKVWCIRDGGEWKDCGEDAERASVASLISEVKRLSGA